MKQRKEWLSGWSKYLKYTLQELGDMYTGQQILVDKMDREREQLEFKKGSTSSSKYLLEKEMPMIFERDKIRIAIGYKRGYRCLAHKKRATFQICLATAPSWKQETPHMYDNLCFRCRLSYKEKTLAILRNKL